MKVVEVFFVAVALVSAAVAIPSFQELEARRIAARERHMAERTARVYSKRQLAQHSTITFSNPKAAEFFVDGRPNAIPEIHFDVGPSWSGV